MMEAIRHTPKRFRLESLSSKVLLFISIDNINIIYTEKNFPGFFQNTNRCPSKNNRSDLLCRKLMVKVH